MTPSVSNNAITQDTRYMRPQQNEFRKGGWCKYISHKLGIPMSDQHAHEHEMAIKFAFTTMPGLSAFLFLASIKQMISCKLEGNSECSPLHLRIKVGDVRTMSLLPLFTISIGCLAGLYYIKLYERNREIELKNSTAKIEQNPPQQSQPVYVLRG